MTRPKSRSKLMKSNKGPMAPVQMKVQQMTSKGTAAKTQMIKAEKAWRRAFLLGEDFDLEKRVYMACDVLKQAFRTANSAIDQLRKDIDIAVITRSEKGCLVISPDGAEAVPAFPVKRVVDTTGAGDLFAAGFLSGLARGADDRTCGRLGALAAGEVIQHLGARPEASLKDLARENGLLD